MKLSDGKADLPEVTYDYHAFAKARAGKGRAAEIGREVWQRHLRTRSLVGVPAVSGPEAEELLKAGAEAVEKKAEDPGVPLTPLQAAGLEAVVRLEDRPALFVLKDDFELPPQRWEATLNDNKADISKRLPVVGGISIVSGGQRILGGTGFVVAPGIVMTNRHVINEIGLNFAVPDINDGPATGAAADSPWKLWNLEKSLQPAIDFKIEHDRPETKQFKIVEVLATTDDDANLLLDVAFLRVEQVSTKVEGGSEGGQPLPPAVKLAASEPDLTLGRELYAVGYPIADNEALPSDPQLRQKVVAAMAQIFGGIYSVKRLQPGELRNIQAAQYVFAHDCSTLGGSSGSCMVDLTTDRVIGIHFKGKRLVSNWAVALWMLKDDVYLRDVLGVKFE